MAACVPIGWVALRVVMIKSAEDIPAMANRMRVYQPVTPSQLGGPVDFEGSILALCYSIEDAEPLCNGNDWG